MDLLLDENKKLKEIIRISDNRIEYLEDKIKQLLTDTNINYCYMCDNLCAYDEEKCEYNMFCVNYICKDCIINLKNNQTNKNMCKYDKCNGWYCPECIKADSECLMNCDKCNKLYCLDHFSENKTTCINCDDNDYECL